MVFSEKEQLPNLSGIQIKLFQVIVMRLQRLDDPWLQVPERTGKERPRILVMTQPSLQRATGHRTVGDEASGGTVPEAQAVGTGLLASCPVLEWSGSSSSPV